MSKGAFDGTRALIAASTHGLGFGVARRLASEGGGVVVSGRTAQGVDEARRAIVSEGGRAEGVVMDVSDGEAVTAGVEEAARLLGGLDILVTNSGGPRPGPFTALSDEDWEGAFHLTLLSAVRLIRAALPHLAAGGRGRICTVTSSSVRQTVDNIILSNAFRPAIHGLVKTLSSELAPQGVLVNVIAPGRFATDRIIELDTERARARGVTREEQTRLMESQIPLGRYGEPDELARAVAFLVSPENTYVTGQALLVDGGMVKAL